MIMIYKKPHARNRCTTTETFLTIRNKTMHLSRSKVNLSKEEISIRTEIVFQTHHSGCIKCYHLNKFKTPSTSRICTIVLPVFLHMVLITKEVQLDLTLEISQVTPRKTIGRILKKSFIIRLTLDIKAPYITTDVTLKTSSIINSISVTVL